MSKTFLRWYFIAAVVGAAVLVALVVRARMAYQLFDIPSESMALTLRIGDHFIVWREAYSSGGPQYGDIVVFRVPQLASVPFVKRIAGLPHDRIRMSGGVLYINGAPASQHRLPDFFDECGNAALSRNIWRHYQPAGWAGSSTACRTAQVTIPNGCCAV